MIIIGPIIGCIRYGRVTIGLELDHTNDIDIELYGNGGYLISTYTTTVPHGKLYTIDIPIDSKHNRYIVSISDGNNTRYGSFHINDMVAVVSCNNRHLGNTDMWDHLSVSSNISTCLHIGDNIYMDYGNDTFIQSQSYDDWNKILDTFRQAYRDLWSTDHMHRILSNHINIFLWDDHDVCDSWDQFLQIDISLWKNDDGSIRWGDIAMAHKDDKKKVSILAAIQVYCEYQLSLSLGGNIHIPGSFIYRIYDRDIVFIDRRSYRALGTRLIPDIDSKVSILVCGVPLFYIHPYLCNRYTNWISRTLIGIRDIYDQWCLSRDDMNSVLDILDDRSIILCGDVHMCGNTHITINSKECIQVTSSAISSPPSPYIISTILRWLSSFNITINDHICSIHHRSWSRCNGYITFHIGNHINSIEYNINE